MTRRTMFQKGEVHNKPSGFWGMIKSITTSAPGSESILRPSAWSFSQLHWTLSIMVVSGVHHSDQTRACVTYNMVLPVSLGQEEEVVLG